LTAEDWTPVEAGVGLGADAASCAHAGLWPARTRIITAAAAAIAALRVCVMKSSIPLSTPETPTSVDAGLCVSLVTQCGER